MLKIENKSILSIINITKSENFNKNKMNHRQMMRQKIKKKELIVIIK